MTKKYKSVSKAVRSAFPTTIPVLTGFLVTGMAYGLSMLEKYKGCGKTKNFLIYYLCDETFVINSTAEIPNVIDKKDFYLAVSLLHMVYWVTASFIGGVLGNVFTFNTAGLDFVLTALFIVLFIEQVKTKKNAVCGIIGIVAGTVSLVVFGADNMVIPAMIIIFIMLLGGRKQLCD